MAAGITLIILQFVTLFVFNECKLNEYYRWKQMSFETLETGKNIFFFFNESKKKVCLTSNACLQTRSNYFLSLP